jgi:hypothetical protein
MWQCIVNEVVKLPHLLTEDMQGLGAVHPCQLFMYRINHQVHRLERQCAEKYVFPVGNDDGGKCGTAIFPPDFYPFCYIIGICFTVLRTQTDWHTMGTLY